jgi:cell wall-associated NlpC family hydrolase
MTMVEALGRVAQIQATLIQLSGVPGALNAAGAAPVDAFAAKLATALGAPASSGVPAASTPGAGSGVSGSDVTAAAKKYLGVPYVFGGEDSSGMDCSGLVQRVYADVGVEVPRLVSGQMKIGTEVGSLAQAKPGDLIVTGGGAHILIYAGNNKVIHAPSPGRTVCLVDAYMKDSDIDTIRRVIPQNAAPAALQATGSTDAFSAALAAFATGGSK